MIEILVGPIASGKSTYAKEKAKQGWVIYNDDAIVNAIHAGFNNLYSKELKPLYKHVENELIRYSLCHKLNIIIDRPNLKCKTRKRYIDIAHKYQTTAHIIMFPFELPEVHAARRFNSDSRGYSYEDWIIVAKKHLSYYESPDLEKENFDSIIKV